MSRCLGEMSPALRLLMGGDDTGDDMHAAPADYRNFQLWMLVPFAISILGFSYSY